MSRMVVPELPASSGAGGGGQTAQAAAVDLDESAVAGIAATATPSARRQASVERQSAPGEVAAGSWKAVGERRQHA